MAETSAVDAELARAVHRVGRRYAAIAPAHRPDVSTATWVTLEAEIDAAYAASSPTRTLRAIAAWERHARVALSMSGSEATG